MGTTGQPELVRAIGRWTLAALVLNTIIGSGIFGLPDDVARRVGGAAPWAYLIAAAGIGVIMAVFAEVGSQFREAGGPYLYARAAFGAFAGVQMGWFAWLVRLTSGAANANLFVVYLGEFWPAATQPVPRAVILLTLISFLTVVNVRGVNAGAQLSNFFVVAKLVPLAIFVFAGLTWSGTKVAPAALDASLGDWGQAILALVFAYGGFESSLMPMSEAKNPRRDAPFALFTGLAAVTVIFTMIHVVAMTTLATLADSQRPLADAARVFLGPAGAALIAAGAMISTYGYLSGQFVTAPRLTYAFAEQRDFPALFGRVHAQFRTPYVSIVIYAVLVSALAIYGSFVWNAILSAVGMLFTYGLVCGALIALRRKNPTVDSFRLPAAWLFVLAGIAFCAVMVAQMNAQHAKIVAVVAAAAVVNWFLARRR